MEIGSILPGTTDADIGRPECLSQIAEAAVGEIDRRTILKCVAREANAHTLLIRFRAAAWAWRIWFPKAAARHLGHFNVVALESTIDRRDLRQT